MKDVVIKFFIFVFLTAAAAFSAVFFLVTWVLSEHLKDDYDWL